MPRSKKTPLHLLPDRFLERRFRYRLIPEDKWDIEPGNVLLTADEFLMMMRRIKHLEDALRRVKGWAGLVALFVDPSPEMMRGVADVAREEWEKHERELDHKR